MSGIFGYNFNKPGPGIDKDAPPKRKFVRFFELFGERFWNLAGVNLMFFICFAILAGISFLLYSYTNQLQVSLIPMIPITLPICGMTLLTRKYVCDESVFIISDFRDAVRTNWLNALIIGIFNYVFVALMSFALPFYWNLAQEQLLFYGVFLLLLTFCLIFLFMQFYLYLMIVTFQLSLKDVFKNSLIFAFANLWNNFLLVIVIFVITFFSMYFFELVETPVLGGIIIVLLCMIIFSGLSFLTNFTVWDRVEELMVIPYEEEEKEDLENSADEEETVADDHAYVFKDGKMVPKEHDQD